MPIDPTADTIAKLVADAETDHSPLRMINLLKFREIADYGDVPDPAGDEGPSSGMAAYLRYGETAMTEVAAVGGSQFYAAIDPETIIGPADEEWDMVAIVQYPSRAAFVEMIGKPSYQAGVFHRTAGLADTRLILTTF